MTSKLLLALMLALAPAPAGATPAKPAQAAGDAALRGAARLIHDKAEGHRLILLGEMHGTREAPRLAAKLAAIYAAEGPLLVGLELSESMAPLIDRYLASDGSEQARLELLANPYWHLPREQSDGRRNVELIALFEQLRQLRVQGRQLRVAAIDNPVGGFDADRNEAMATRVRNAYSALPGDGHALVVTGNAHAMLVRPDYAPPEMRPPMGSYLHDLDPYSVDIAAASGQHWGCRQPMSQCQAVDESGHYGLSGPVEDDTFSYRVVLPRYSVAPLID